MKHQGERKARYIKWFDQISYGDVALVGGKNASLGELYRELRPEGVRVPNGFALTADAYRRHLDANGLTEKLRDIVQAIDKKSRAEDLQQRGERARHLIADAPLPADVESEIASAYASLCRERHGDESVAVRSSATAEDLPEASFAGQQESFLNVRGKTQLLAACKACFASLFTDRAISYRVDKGFDHLHVALSIGVQAMVRSDVGAAGVLFTLDTDSGLRSVVLINAAYGLGETVVQGTVNPDEILVFKPSLAQGKSAILRKRVGSKEFKTVYDEGGSRRTKTVRVPDEDRARLSIGEADALELARWGCCIEVHYGKLRGGPVPMDVEWAKDGLTGELFVVQARPETVQAQRGKVSMSVYELDQKAKDKARVIATGQAVGDKVAVGPVRVIRDVHKLGELRSGEVLVTTRTDPDWEPSMKLAAAIVTEHGGRTCHAAIVSRELGIPAVVGAPDATKLMQNGEVVTVSCAEGAAGRVYDGELPFRREEIDLTLLKLTLTDVMMNVANPDEAMHLAMLPNDGVGLARIEFVIAHGIRVHPMALVHFDELPFGPERREIERLTAGYARKTDFFVDRLAEGVAMIAAPFHPRPVIVRFSDFKTNEYAGLLGGHAFEPSENNPMLGFRGASRYYHERYREGFALECAAIRKVRDEMGLTNVKVMIPFCRTVEEGERVLAEMAKNGLRRGENGLQIYVMCEVPSNVILAEEFAAIFDGFSIGSNDLTQLTLGIDRDSEILAPLFDERNEAVKRLVATVIDKVRRAGRKVGICGQAPSDYPEFAAFLVREGIDSISLNPDAVVSMLRLISEVEEIGGDR